MSDELTMRVEGEGAVSKRETMLFCDIRLENGTCPYRKGLCPSLTDPNYDGQACAHWRNQAGLIKAIGKAMCDGQMKY